jgi:hypothetical protein
VDKRPAPALEQDEHIVGGSGSSDHLARNPGEWMPGGDLSPQFPLNDRPLALFLHTTATQVPPGIGKRQTFSHPYILSSLPLAGACALV